MQNLVGGYKKRYYKKTNMKTLLHFLFHIWFPMMLWQFHSQDLSLLLQWFIDWYFALPNKHTALTFSFGSDTEPTLSII